MESVVLFVLCGEPRESLSLFAPPLFADEEEKDEVVEVERCTLRVERQFFSSL